MSRTSRPGFPARTAVPSAGAAGVIPAGPGRQAAQQAQAVRTALSASPAGVGLDSAAFRQKLVSGLRAEGISSAPVLEAMLAVERHRFVDSALVNQAYEDTSLPIGLGQTISKPSVVARMIELLLGAPVWSQPAQAGLARRRVLEIGTGCGYQAAVLARVCGEVYSIERLRGLHEKARENLRPFRLPNVHLLLGDGMLGYERGAPYAGIIAAAGGMTVPQPWLDQLAVGGRIVAPLHSGGRGQSLVVFERGDRGITQTVLEAVHFVPLKSGIV